MEILIFIIGMCCGSFVNMLVYRTAIKYGLKSKKILNQVQNDKVSFCDFCGRQLKWYENIPVLSWVIQKGRSKCCDNPLPWEYPVVEVGTGILFLINLQFTKEPIYETIFNFQFFNLQIILELVVVAMLVFALVFDAKYMILPDFSTIILVVVAVLRLFMIGVEWSYIISAVGASGFLGFLYLVTKGKGMGLGDVKLAIFMGLWLGWPNIVLAFYIAFIVGAVFGVILMAGKKLKRKSLVAFGPFLILGTIVSSFWGEKIILMLNFLY